MALCFVGHRPFSLFTPGVELGNLVLQEAVVEVRVDFGCGDLCVPEHFLDSTQIRSAFDQMGCKAVSECVWTNILTNPSSYNAPFEHGERHLARHFSSLAPEEQDVFMTL